MEVCLVHPIEMRVIVEARVENDRLDAKVLARLLRADLVVRS